MGWNQKLSFSLPNHVLSSAMACLKNKSCKMNATWKLMNYRTNKLMSHEHGTQTLIIPWLNMHLDSQHHTGLAELWSSNLKTPQLDLSDHSRSLESTCFIEMRKEGCTWQAWKTMLWHCISSLWIPAKSITMPWLVSELHIMFSAKQVHGSSSFEPKPSIIQSTWQLPGMKVQIEK